MNVPIVCFVGKSGVGKTTFLEKLIPELVSRGHRVGIVKHDTHGFEMDRPGKDTWRLRQAGACRVAISSPQRFAIIGEVERELALPEVAERYLDDVDIVLTEGYKRSDQPKVELCRSARSRELLCSPEELVAVISDLRFDLPCPQFDLENVAGVADLLEERFLRRPILDTAQQQVSLTVDGSEVPLKPFVQEMLANVVHGLLAALKAAQGEEIELHIRGPE
jgi:molybdopterin-guanine dinucleotide biosynthesis protein B